MATNKVDSIYDIKAIETEQDKVLKGLQEIAKEMANLSKVSLGNKKQFEGANDLNQLSEAQKNYATNIEKTQAVLKENEKLLKQKIDLEAKLLAAQSEQAKANAKVREEITKQNAANKDFVKGMMGAGDSIVRQRLQLKELQKEFYNLSKAERESEAGQLKAKEINALNDEIGKAEQSLGNFTRQVGKYEVAGKALKQELKGILAELTYMKVEGSDMGEGAERFKELTMRAGELKDTIEGAAEEVAFFASDTKNLDGIINGIEGVVGAWGAVQGAMALVGGENKELEETFTKLQAVMTIIQSLQAVQNALQKESAFNMLASNFQRKMQVTLTMLEEKATKQNIATKWLNIAAQKALNLAMSLSPFGMLIAGVAALSLGYLALNAALNKKSKTQKIDNEILKQSAENSAEERVELGLAVAKIKEAKQGRGDLTKAIDAYNEKFGETGKLTKEIVEDEKQFNDLIAKQTQLILIRARAEAYKQKIIELEKENIKVQTEGIEWWKKALNVIATGTGSAIQNEFDKSKAIAENNKTIEWAAKVHLALTQQVDNLKVAKKEDTKETKNSEAAYVDWAKRIFEITQDLRQSQLDLLKESREKEKGELQIKYENEMKALEEGMKKEPQIREFYQKIIENKKEAHRKAVQEIDNKFDLEAEKQTVEKLNMQIENEQNFSNEQLKLKIDANNKERDIEIKEAEKTGADVVEITRKYKKKEQEIRNEFLKNSAETEVQKRININNAAMEAELKELDKQLKKKEITVEEYDKKALEISSKYADLELNNAIIILEEEIKMIEGNNELKAQLEQELIDKKKELYEKDRENFIENEKEKAEKEAEIRQSAAESFNSIMSSVAEIQNSQFENKLTQIDEEQAIADEQLQKDLERAGTNEAYKEQLQKQADKRTKDREKERKKIQLEQAKFEQNKAIFDATVGMLKEIAKNAGNPILIAFATLTGLAQIAAIKATPLPKYAKGRKGGKSEFAVVGEAGTEAVIDHTSKSFKIFDKETITHLPAGADVLTAHETQKIMASQNLQSYEKMTNFANNVNDSAKLYNEFKEIKTILKRKEVPTINIIARDEVFLTKMRNLNY